MNLPGRVLRHREPAAAAQMVVVRADDHDFRLQRRVAAFQRADHVANRPAHSRRCARRRSRSRRGAAATSATGRDRSRLDAASRFSRVPSARWTSIARQENTGMPKSSACGSRSHRRNRSSRRAMIRVIDDRMALGAVLPRDFDLAHHRRVHRVRLSLERASRVVLLRLVRENQHRFVRPRRSPSNRHSEAPARRCRNPQTRSGNVGRVRRPGRRRWTEFRSPARYQVD